VLADDAPVIRPRVAREHGIRALTNVATAARVLLCVLLLADPADAAADTAHHDDAQLVAGLRAVGLVPPIAGRSPTYLLRQLVAFRTGAPMEPVADQRVLKDMIAVAAYAGSVQP
jgi:cytochrome c553